MELLRNSLSFHNIFEALWQNESLTILGFLENCQSDKYLLLLTCVLCYWRIIPQHNLTSPCSSPSPLRLTVQSRKKPLQSSLHTEGLRRSHWKMRKNHNNWEGALRILGKRIYSGQRTVLNSVIYINIKSKESSGSWIMTASVLFVLTRKSLQKRSCGVGTDH